MPESWNRRAGVLAMILLFLRPSPCFGQNRGPSPAFQAELRKTLEQRRARRARTGMRPPNAIVPWLMPPALIIRATPEVHDEVQTLLDTLRSSTPRTPPVSRIPRESRSGQGSSGQGSGRIGQSRREIGLLPCCGRNPRVRRREESGEETGNEQVERESR